MDTKTRDMAILIALYNGGHLDNAELQRAEVLIDRLNGHVRERIKNRDTHTKA